MVYLFPFYIKLNLGFTIFNSMSMSVSNRVGDESKMNPPSAFRTLLTRRGYSDKAIKEIWKWYDFLERRGVNY